MKPAHGIGEYSKMWVCNANIGIEQPAKLGCTKITTIKRCRVPRVSMAMRKRFATLCALEVYDVWKHLDKGGEWKTWADSCLNGKMAANAADAARATNAAMAANAANAAADAARAAWAADAARAAWAAWAAAAAARAAAAAARAEIDLNAIAQKACNWRPDK
jgi:hypothetical protein